MPGRLPYREGKPVRMETVGGATTFVAALGGCVLVLGYALDQVPTLTDKAVKALEAARRLRRTWRDEQSAVDEPAPDNGDESVSDADNERGSP